MDFTGALSALLSYQFLLLALGINVITYILRTITEYLFPSIVNLKVYQKLFLPLSPAFLGIMLGIIAVKYTFPDNMNTLVDRIICGAVAGNFGALLYQVTRGMFKEKIQELKQSMRNDGYNQQP